MGSGQMAIEALSLGFGSVIGCDLDPSRVRFLLKVMKRHGYPIRVYRRDFQRSVALLLEHKQTVFFLDPPYTFWKDGPPDSIHGLMERLAEEALRSHLIGFVQGPQPYALPLQDSSRKKKDALPKFRVESRRHRGQYLTLLEYRAVGKKSGNLSEDERSK